MDSIGELFDKVKQEAKVLLGDKSKDKVYSSRNDFPDEATAAREFTRSVTKLFRVDAWSDLPGFNSTFELYGNNGERKAEGQPRVGDYIRISLPGPLPENWVEIIDLRTSDQEAEFTVSPSPHPQPKSPDEAKEVKHFFHKEATSTFRVKRQGNAIEAFEIGKNEAINNRGEEAGDRALVNTVVAEGGWAGVQAIQWNKLTDYLVHLL